MRKQQILEQIQAIIIKSETWKIVKIIDLTTIAYWMTFDQEFFFFWQQRTFDLVLRCKIIWYDQEIRQLLGYLII